MRGLVAIGRRVRVAIGLVCDLRGCVKFMAEPLSSAFTLVGVRRFTRSRFGTSRYRSSSPPGSPFFVTARFGHDGLLRVVTLLGAIKKNFFAGSGITTKIGHQV